MNNFVNVDTLVNKLKQPMVDRGRWLGNFIKSIVLGFCVPSKNRREKLRQLYLDQLVPSLPLNMRLYPSGRPSSYNPVRQGLTSELNGELWQRGLIALYVIRDLQIRCYTPSIQTLALCVTLQKEWWISSQRNLRNKYKKWSIFYCDCS